MKKFLATILAICLLCATAAAFAEDTVFTTDWYSVKLPEGNWERVEGQEGITYYYLDGNIMNGAVMFVVQDMEPDVAANVTDEMTPLLYNVMISSLTQYAVDGKVDQEESVMAGRPGVIFSYVQEESGLKINVIGNCVYIGGHMLVVCYMHLTKPAEEIREILTELSDSVVYLGE